MLRAARSLKEKQHRHTTNPSLHGSSRPVYQSLGLQVLHAVAYLHGEVAEGQRREAGAHRRLLETLEEGAQGSQLGDEHQAAGIEDDAEQAHDVRVVDGVHDRRLLEELDGVGLHAFAR